MQGDFPSWSLTAVSGENVIGSAEWYGGPLRLNPHQALIERAHLTNDAYSYGVMTSSGPGDFDNGMLIGAVEKGTTLTVGQLPQARLLHL